MARQLLVVLYMDLLAELEGVEFLDPLMVLVEKVLLQRLMAKMAELFLVMPLESMDFELAPTGAARISGRIGDAVLLNRGTNTLVVVVGQEDRLPDEAKLFRLFEQSGPLERVLLGDGWQAWRVPLVFEALPK